MQKIKYITNKDLLRELALSKSSYCSYISDEYRAYDVIVNDLVSITDTVIREAQEKRAAGQMLQERQRQKEAGIKNHCLAVTPVDAASIPVDSLVFRVMT